MKELSKAIENIIATQKKSLSPKSIKNTEKDGLMCDAAHHKKLYEDDIIRVLDVIVPIGGDEPFHTHELPSVMYLDMPAKIEYSIFPGKVVFTSPADKERQPGLTYLTPEDLHKVRNIDNKVFRAFRIEIKYDIDLEITPNIDELLKNEVEKQRVMLDMVRCKILLEEQQLEQQSESSSLEDMLLEKQKAGITTSFENLKDKDSTEKANVVEAKSSLPRSKNMHN